MSQRPSLDEYIDVAERIAEFNAKYPEGTLQTIGWEDRKIGDKTFIVYRAAAYRTPRDPRPGVGNAWEPFPGPTPYTRDSELMNAETAAWGRAIVACGITASRKIASRQEVQARAGEEPKRETPKPRAAPVQQTERTATADQRGMLHGLANGLDASTYANAILEAAGGTPREWASEQAAAQWVKTRMDRLPARLVTPLKQIILREKDKLAAKASTEEPTLSEPEPTIPLKIEQ